MLHDARQTVSTQQHAWHGVKEVALRPSAYHTSIETRVLIPSPRAKAGHGGSHLSIPDSHRSSGLAGSESFRLRETPCLRIKWKMSEEDAWHQPSASARHTWICSHVHTYVCALAHRSTQHSETTTQDMELSRDKSLGRKEPSVWLFFLLPTQLGTK